MDDLQAKIKAEYEAGAGPKALAEKYGISVNNIKSWIRRYGWKRVSEGAPSTGEGAPSDASELHPEERATSPPKGKAGAPTGNQNAKGHGAPPGNKNALGNNGGAPPRNKNAVRTGEFETIWLDQLDDDEVDLISKVDVDPLAAIEDEIMLITIRERRMLQRIQDLKNGLSEKSRRVLQERQKTKEPYLMQDESGKSKTVMIDKYQLVTAEIEETEMRKIDDILAIEEALTRVQAQKLKAIQTKAALLKDAEMLEIARERLVVEQRKVELAVQRMGGGGSGGGGTTIIDDIGSDFNGIDG